MCKILPLLSTSQSASATLVRPVHLSDSVSEQPADSHNWSAAPRGVTFTKTRHHKPSAVTNEPLSVFPSLFFSQSLVFTPKNVPF